MRTDPITAATLKEQVPAFAEVSGQRLRAIAEGSDVIRFVPNQPIMEFGEAPRFLGVVLEGEIEISVTDNAGDAHTIERLGPGALFGESGILKGARTEFDATGRTPGRALLIPNKLVETLLAAERTVSRELARVLSVRMRALGERGGAADRADGAEPDPYGLALRTAHPMRILVLNSGSSSLKYRLFDTGHPELVVRGIIERLGTPESRIVYRHGEDQATRELGRAGHREAFAAMLDGLTQGAHAVLRAPREVGAVGHRIVHGGSLFEESVLITEEVVRNLEQLVPLAPLHAPVNLAGVREAMSVFPTAHHIAVFDTAFHQTLPPYARVYGLPHEYYEKKGIRRYGFHGMSHAWASLRAAQCLERPYNELEIITCHLGNGASVCAIDHGRSIDTSMGFTPTQGLIMGTRCGDLDPAIPGYLMSELGLDADAVARVLNVDGGLKGLSGISNDMREIEAAAQDGHPRALLAFQAFCYGIRKYIGAYVAAMGGLDTLVFTGGIGAGSVGVRSLACQGLECMGIRIDRARNTSVTAGALPCDIAEEHAPVRVLVIPAEEERMIAREVIRTLARRQAGERIRLAEALPIPIEVSAHHVHLSAAHVEALFGNGHVLTRKDPLSQPGQYACEETVALVGPKGTVKRVRVLGPCRSETQIEISMTEQFKLGIHPPIRESGDLANTPGITLEGTAGRITTRKGVICALRHIHMTPEDAARVGLKDHDKVRVRVEGNRELVFGDVLVRVRSDYTRAMHLDTDEANAAHVRTGMTGYVERIQNRD